jgi:hypothetical protein
MAAPDLQKLLAIDDSVGLHAEHEWLDQEHAAALARQHNLTVLPVVDGGSCSAACRRRRCWTSATMSTRRTSAASPVSSVSSTMRALPRKPLLCAVCATVDLP